ncbi:TNF receptor-associated factor 4 [Elysia marginata]|uniref:TNF receptor-associated factor 4 n=1 Tax=Elysia marginata TaxID=1093978 RepID=A0AAV4H345_9GAST|nr:TNF receptor-associated factor 4 [Elysia marginata]
MARAIHNTDCKSLLCSGDRPSVDETELKRLEADGRDQSQYFSLSDDDGNGDGDDDDTKSVYYDVPSGSVEDLIRAIADLQRQQESLKSLHAEHDKKLEELLRQQPTVNEQFKKIRQNSTRRPSTSTETTNISSQSSHNSNSSSNIISSTNNSSSCSGGDLNKQVDGNGSDKSNNNNGNIYSNTARWNDGVVAPNDQVIHRKPSKGGSRNENDLVEFQRLLFSEQQNQVYVQLEKLYNNFQRLHLPTKTVQTLMEGNMIFATVNSPTLDGLEASGAGGPELPARDYEGNKIVEETRTIRENLELKKMNEELKKEVEEIRKEWKAAAARRTPPPLPPKPDFHAYTSSPRGRPPKLGNIKQQTLQHAFVTGKPTSPMSSPVLPSNIDIREISIQHKIEGYKQKLHQETLHEGRKQVSNSFYTTYGGCRAQLEVFLNGNGTGHNRCMSLFVRVVPGEFDDFIKWPITLHIRATLMNQNRGLPHSVEDHGNQFQFSKPRGSADTESDCWGLVEFVSHKMISQPGFIKDDAIVLRCKITFSSSLS